MKTFLLLIALVFAYSGYSQNTKVNLAKNLASADRKEILEALRKKAEPDLRQKPKLVVNELWAKNGFAYFIGRVKGSDGKNINFRKTVYKEQVDAGIFDGDGTNALLRKTGGKWKVLAFVIGPSDVPWGCWWKEFKAPKEIFDYAEASCE